ncbi:hypothetical protein ACROYT_G021740 [Oculina patagonica]
MLFPEEEAWRRRRRRRWHPPPPQNCVLSAWSSWSACSQQCHIGISTRYRTVVTGASWGGSCSYHFHESQSCGSINGGCDQICNNQNGACSCQTGYTKSGKKCNDNDECAPNGGNGPCSHICKNTVGSYNCQCPTGYYLSSDSHQCLAYDCGDPASLFKACPSDSYTDHISSVCSKVTANCLHGTTYNQQCSLNCPKNYTLAKITAQPNKKFGEDYSSVDFSSVMSSITCQKTQAAKTSNVWDVLDNELSHYYCRRTNDPPLDLNLIGSVLKEHSAIGTVIGTLSSQDMQPGQTFMYTVQKPSALLAAQGDKLINVWDNPILNGNVSLNNGKLAVTIRTTDNGFPPMWLEKTFPITILNVNDPPEQVNLSNTVVYENATIGMVIGELTAIDGDDPPNTDPHSNFKWELLKDGNGKFGINVNKVVVAQSLAPGLFKITVKCSDFGNPVNFTSEDFIIDVMNLNDVPHSLQLTRSTVHEMALVNTVVGQLVVIDKDGDDVSFDISQSDAVTLNKFNIGDVRCKRTGNGQDNECRVNVTVKSPLNYEEKAWYTLNVQANDSHTRAFKRFNIEVINDNEAPTAISLTGSHSVLENAVAGTVVGQFVVTDPDNARSPSHQRHTCLFDISQPSDENYFTISTGLVLKVKGAQQIDYERIKSLTFTVICSDSGHPPLSLSTGFVISVKDVNEPPVNLTLSSTTVDENTPLDTPVGSLSSDDPDQPGGVHTYSIVGPAGVPFKIGGTNNKTLLVNGPLDHETNPTILVIVRVTDDGGLFMEKTFKITVNDVNDPPSNLTLVPTPILYENSAERVLISSIVLTDQDRDLPSCRLSDSSGGRVKVVGTNLVVGPTATDYESDKLPSTKEFSITLNCSDGHGKFIAKSFLIKVVDVNEAPSEIKLSATTVRENEPDAVVGKVTVSDPDMGQQHRCTVFDRIVDGRSSTGTPSQFFTVDSALNLKTLHGLNFEAQHSLDVMLNCSDVVADSLFKTELFTIVVKDVNEIPSGVCSKPILVGLKTSVGAVIVALRGDDPDNENAIHNNPSNHSVVVKNKQQLMYSLSAEKNAWPFAIKGNSLFKSGVISSPQNFTIGVKVKDDGIIVSSFSSKGYQYTVSKPLSAVFNCTIVVSEHHQITGILLEPSQVSITADIGAVIGTLTTVTQNPGETFLYELVDQAQMPFSITGNKLVVTKKEGLDFQVSSSEESLIPISIISKGSVSGVIRESFYVRIVDDRPHPVDMCLIPHTVKENQPSGTIVGQLIIDDSSSPLLSCSKQHCCPNPQSAGKYFDYRCHVDNRENNEAIPSLQRNVSTLFRLDDGFLLRTRVPILYSDFKESNGSVEIHFSCYDTRHPLHFIGHSLQVLVSDCDNSGVCPDVNNCPACQNGGSCQDVIDGYSCQCMLGYTGDHCETDIDECQSVECKNGGICEDGIASFTCTCADGFSGELCERQPSLCGNCVAGTLCVTFIQAPIRCLEKQYQIPVLVSETGISSKRTFELEEEIGAILDAKRSDGNKSTARKRRAHANFFYVEILRINQLSTQKQSLLILTALDATNQYFPLLASEACAMLANTERACVENCEILKLVNLPCGSGGSNKNIGAPTEEVSKGLATGGKAGIAVVVIILIIAALVGALFYYRRKYKVAKQDQGGVRYQSGAEDIDFSNPVYGDNRTATIPPASREWAEKLKKDSDGLVRHNLDPTSVIKRNDIKVSENPLYNSRPTNNAGQREEFSNPLHMKAVNLPEEDGIAAAKARNKGEKPYMEPKEGARGGASNPCYEMSPPMRVSLGKNSGEPQGDEIVQAEQNAYLKGAKAKVRASNASQPKKFKRQRSDEKTSHNEERRSLRNSEVPPSFDNPFYSDSPARDQANPSEDPTYATIPALQGGRPGLPPRTARKLHERPPEPIEFQDDDDTYEKVTFGDTEA